MSGWGTYEAALWISLVSNVGLKNQHCKVIKKMVHINWWASNFGEQQWGGRGVQWQKSWWMFVSVKINLASMSYISCLIILVWTHNSFIKWMEDIWWGSNDWSLLVARYWSSFQTILRVRIELLFICISYSHLRLCLDCCITLPSELQWIRLCVGSILTRLPVQWLKEENRGNRTWNSEWKI